MTEITGVRCAATAAVNRGYPETWAGFQTVGAGGRYPTVRVQIDFANDPGSHNEGWSDVTPYARGVSYSRGGRNNELQRTEAGTLQLLLDNRDGRFDPTNTASPYYPGVKRMRRIRVQARWNSVTYSRWYGFIEAWQLDWPGFGHDATAQVSAADAFKVLNLYDLDGKAYPAGRTDQRVTAVCADVGLQSQVSQGATDDLVATGTIDAGTIALSHLQAVEETENGLLFADADGRIIFRDRHWRIVNVNSSVGTIGDLAGEIPYADATMSLDDGDIWNSVAVTPSGGTQELANNATSIAEHFQRRMNRSILTGSQPDAEAAANYLATRYADSSPRMPAVTLLPENATDKWATVLGADNGDRFPWKRRYTGGTVSQDTYLEQVSEQIQPGRGWQIRWQLSPADTETAWLLDNASFSILDTTTRLSY